MVKDSPILELKMSGATVSQEEEINSGRWYVGGSPRQLSVLIVHLKDTQNSEKLLYAVIIVHYSERLITIRKGKVHTEWSSRETRHKLPVIPSQRNGTDNA